MLPKWLVAGTVKSTGVSGLIWGRGTAAPNTTQTLLGVILNLAEIGVGGVRAKEGGRVSQCVFSVIQSVSLEEFGLSEATTPLVPPAHSEYRDSARQTAGRLCSTLCLSLFVISCAFPSFVYSFVH